MKVIFIGMHNKEGKEPLDSTTKSGAIIDRIIDGLAGIEVLKTNMWDVHEFPPVEWQIALSCEWWRKVSVSSDDVIVLLGAIVHRNFDYRKERCDNVLKIAHPSSCNYRSKHDTEKYIASSIEAINNLLKK